MERVRREPWGFLHRGRSGYFDESRGMVLKDMSESFRLLDAIASCKMFSKGPGPLGAGTE